MLFLNAQSRHSDFSEENAIPSWKMMEVPVLSRGTEIKAPQGQGDPRRHTVSTMVVYQRYYVLLECSQAPLTSKAAWLKAEM
eukprot:1144805-Pelagomonas_calceolata.AAC.3